MYGKSEYIVHGGNLVKLDIQQLRPDFRICSALINNVQTVVVPIGALDEFEDGVRFDEAIWSLVSILIDRLNGLLSSDESLKTKQSQLESVLESATIAMGGMVKKEEVEKMRDTVRGALLGLEEVKLESRTNVMRLDAHVTELRELRGIVTKEEVEKMKYAVQDALLDLEEVKLESRTNVMRLDAHVTELRELRGMVTLCDAELKREVEKVETLSEDVNTLKMELETRRKECEELRRRNDEMTRQNGEMWTWFQEMKATESTEKAKTWLSSTKGVPKTSDGKWDMETVFYVVEQGELDVLKYLNTLGLIDGKVKDSDGMNISLVAACNGQLEVLKYLHTLGLIDGKEKASFSRNISLVAACYGQLEVLKYLHTLGLIDGKEKDSNGWNISLVAACYGELEVLKYLHTLGLIDGKEKASNGMNISLVAACIGQLEVLKYLHTLGLIDGKEKDSNGMTLAKLSNSEVLQWLKGVNLA